MQIRISTNTNGDIRVETIVEQDNMNCVDICLSQDLVYKTNILCLNSGIPGVTGPDIPFRITEVLDPILEYCTEKAKRGI